MSSWDESVKNAVRGTIANYLRRHRFDDITTPRFDENDPREEIANQLNIGDARNRLKGVGSELIWVDMGHFEIVDKRVETQLIDTWGAKWLGNARYNKRLEKHNGFLFKKSVGLRHMRIY